MGSDRQSSIFRNREFRAIWGAELCSVAGDQFAAVALAVIVYAHTGSATWAAATYALTFLPALLGGVLLSWIADRFARRDVMVVSDVLRAVLLAVMAIPALPVWVACTLLVVVVLLASPHSAAQGALMPEILRGELYERGLAVRQTTHQSAQLIGFAMGGVLVATMSPSTALLIDAATFVAAALMVRLGVSHRTPPAQDAAERTSSVAAVTSGIAAIVKDPQRRTLAALVWIVSCYVLPEALAVPYAAQLGAGPATAGLLMAAGPCGSALGAWLFVRLVSHELRSRLIGVLAAGAGLPLVATWWQPGLAVTLILWVLSGMLAIAFLIQTQACFVRATPDVGRGQAIGIVSSGIVAFSGLFTLLGGVLADLWGPAAAIAVVGAAGVVLASVGAMAWSAARRRPASTTTLAPSALGA